MPIVNFKPVAIDYHRNGISGAPFYAVIFDAGFAYRDKGVEPPQRFVAVVFKQPLHVAVLRVEDTVKGSVEFGANSWRGDMYEPHLREAINKHRLAEGIDEGDW